MLPKRFAIGWLWSQSSFRVGHIGVGFLAVPVMTTSAAYDLAQTMRWKHGLSVKPKEAMKFYCAIVVFTLWAVGP